MHFSVIIIFLLALPLVSSAFVVLLPSAKTTSIGFSTSSLSPSYKNLLLTTKASALYTSSEQEVEEDEDDATPKPPLPSIEKAWRHAKKPLLRIGGKGATKTHGNSLRQLLEDHTVVKVKINTQKYGSLMDSFLVLSKLAEEAGAPEGVEYIQSRQIEKTVMFGMPGTLASIESGDFPPPPPPPYVPPVRNDEEEE